MDMSTKSFNSNRVKDFLLSKEVKTYSTAILSFFALAFFVLFAIRPTLISFVSLQKKIENAQNLNQKLEDKIRSLLQAQEAFQKHQSDLVLLDEALPQTPEFTAFLQRLESVVNEQEATTAAFETTKQVSLLGNAAQTTGEDLAMTENIGEVEPSVESSGEEEADGILPSEPAEESKSTQQTKLTVPYLGFKIETSSDYLNNKSILQSIMNLRRIIALSSYKFYRSEGDSSEAATDTSVNLIIEAKAYYYPDEQ